MQHYEETDSIAVARKNGVSALRSEKGVALVVVLVFSAIALAIMTTILYLIISGTQVSGMSKNYKTAKEAGLGGTEIVQQFIDTRGTLLYQQTLMNDLNTAFDLTTLVTTSATCTGKSLITGATYTGLAAKLMTASTKTNSTANWSGCSSSMAINPDDATTYDIKMTIGTGTKYNVYAKIVDTVEGNTTSSGISSELWTHGSVDSSVGQVEVMQTPYMYTIEVDAENNAVKAEKSTLQVLYQY